MEKSKVKKDKHLSMKDIFVYHKRQLIIGLILVFFYNIIIYTLLSYMPSHLSAVLGYGKTKSLMLVLIVMVIMIPMVLTMGNFSDRISGKRIVQGGLIGLIFLSIPAFLLIGSGNNWLIFLGLLILAVFLASFQGTMPSLLPSLFFTEVRNGSLAITYNISTSLFGGTAPLLVTWLISMTGDRLIPAYYIVFSCLIGIVVVTYFVRNTSGKPLRGSHPAVAEKQEIDTVLENSKEELWWADEKNKIDENMNNYDDKK